MTTLNDAFNLAAGHMAGGRRAEAEAVFRKILDAVPDHSPSLMMAGVIAFQDGRTEVGLARLDRALAVNPAFAEAMYNRAVLLGVLGRADEAVTAYRRALALRPAHAGTRRNLAAALAQAGERDEAEALLAGLAAQLPEPDPDLLLQLGLLRLEMGRFGGAMDACLDALVVKPDHAAAYEGFRGARQELAHARSLAGRFAAGGGGSGRDGATNIYIKCYSRPMYLDRCLESMRRNLSNHGRIIVLNDGIGEPYLGRLRERHPEVEFRTSPKLAAGIVAAPANDRLKGRVRFFRDLDHLDPGRFWVEEVSKDPNDHVMIFEEDCWFFRPLDVARAVEVMRTHHTLVYGMLYENEQHRTRRKQTQRIDRTATIHGDVAVDFYHHDLHPTDWQQNYPIFPIANTLFDKDYWLNSYEGILHWTDERHVVIKAARLIGWLRRHGFAPTLGQIDGGVVRHSRSSTARSDAGGRSVAHPIDPYVFNGLLNRLWLEGGLDIMAGYPDDLPEEYLIELMAPHLDAEDIAAWRRWRAEFLSAYWFYNQ